MRKSMLQRLRHACLYLGGLGAIATSGVALAQMPTSDRNLAPSGELPAITRRQTPIDSSGDYRSEVQACLSGEHQQARANCLEEARHAQAARRRGELAMPGEDYMANALARCEPLTGIERGSCEARVLGFGNASGSVAGGGLLRWVETVVLPRSEEQVSFVPKTPEPVVVIPSR